MSSLEAFMLRPGHPSELILPLPVAFGSEQKQNAPSSDGLQPKSHGLHSSSVRDQISGDFPERHSPLGCCKPCRLRRKTFMAGLWNAGRGHCVQSNVQGLESILRHLAEESLILWATRCHLRIPNASSKTTPSSILAPSSKARSP